MTSFSYYPDSFRTHSTFSPAGFPYESPIRNSPGRDSEPSQGSSILADNEPNGDRSSSGVLSSMNARNEDLTASTTQLSISPYVRGPSIPVRDGFRSTSFTDFDAPLSLRSNGFQSSQAFTTGFPPGGDQPDTTAGYASVVSIFCHDCGLFFRGVREEGLEVLDRHQCMGPINGGYAYDFDFQPLHSNGRRWPLYREEYFEPNLTNAGSGMMVDLPPVAHRRGSYFDGPHRSAMNQRRYPSGSSHNYLNQLSGQQGPTPPRFEQQRDTDTSGFGSGGDL